MARKQDVRSTDERHAATYDPNDWEVQARRVVLDAMHLANVDWPLLAELLVKNGYEDKLTVHALKQRIARCKFSASFLIQLLKVLDDYRDRRGTLLNLGGQITMAWKDGEVRRKQEEAALPRK